MEDRVVLKQLITRDGFKGPIEVVDQHLSPTIYHAINWPLGVHECGEIASSSDHSTKPKVRQYQMAKQISCVLLVYEEVYSS